MEPAESKQPQPECHRHIGGASATQQLRPLPTSAPHKMTIHQVLKAFYILSKLLGFSWFRLHGYKWKMQKWLDRVILLVNISLRLAQVWSTMSMPFPISTPISYTLWFAFLGTNASLPLVHIFMSYWKRVAQARVIDTLDRFDRQLEEAFDKPQSHLRHQKYVRIFMCVVFLVVPSIFFATCFIRNYNYDLRSEGHFPFSMMIFAGISILNYTVSISHILLVALAALLRFSALRSTATSLLLPTTLKVEVAGDSAEAAWQWRKRGGKVRQLRILYGLLVETVDEINNGFALIGLACTTVCFVVLLSSTFANYEAIIGDANGGGQTPIPVVLMNVLWCSFYNAFLIGTVSINGRIKEQVSSLQFIIT